jgi:hypothetical protein
MKRFLPILLVLGCTTMQDGTAPAAQTPAAQSQFKNLQVLPRDISRDQLLATMRSFTRGLGVKCNYCHVVTATEPKEQLDFPADTKEEKRIARVMMRMTNDINGPWMERVEVAEHGAEAAKRPASAVDADDGGPQEPKVMCWTCHRGKARPEMPPPPAEPHP